MMEAEEVEEDDLDAEDDDLDAEDDDGADDLDAELDEADAELAAMRAITASGLAASSASGLPTHVHSALSWMARAPGDGDSADEGDDAASVDSVESLPTSTQLEIRRLSATAESLLQLSATSRRDGGAAAAGHAAVPAGDGGSGGDSDSDSDSDDELEDVDTPVASPEEAVAVAEAEAVAEAVAVAPLAPVRSGKAPMYPRLGSLAQAQPPHPPARAAHTTADADATPLPTRGAAGAAVYGGGPARTSAPAHAGPVGGGAWPLGAGPVDAALQALLDTDEAYTQLTACMALNRKIGSKLDEQILKVSASLTRNRQQKDRLTLVLAQKARAAPVKPPPQAKCLSGGMTNFVSRGGKIPEPNSDVKRHQAIAQSFMKMVNAKDWTDKENKILEDNVCAQNRKLLQSRAFVTQRRAVGVEGKAAYRARLDEVRAA